MGQSRSKREETRASSVPKERSVDFGGEWSASNVDFEEAEENRRVDSAHNLMSDRDKGEIRRASKARLFAPPSRTSFEGMVKSMAGQHGAYTTEPGGDIRVARDKKKDKHQ